MAPSLSYLRLLGRSGRSCTRSMSSVHQDSYIDAIESRKRSRKSAEFDTLGTWDTRLNVKIDEDATLRTGHIVPQIEVSLVGEATHLGRRNYQEDRARVEQLRSDLLYLAVFDGHGGEACAEYCHHNFHRHILHHLEREQDLDVVLRKSFHDVNRSFERWCQCQGKKESPVSSSGTTATVCLLQVQTGPSTCRALFRGVTTPAVLWHKEPAWTSLPSFLPYAIKNQRGASKIPLVWGFGCDVLVLDGIKKNHSEALDQ